jgi:hypothetical protein
VTGAWTFEDGEFAVRVCRVDTRNGERLRIERDGGDVAVELDAIELESLTVEGLDLKAYLGLGEGAS